MSDMPGFDLARRLLREARRRGWIRRADAGERADLSELLTPDQLDKLRTATISFQEDDDEPPAEEEEALPAGTVVNGQYEIQGLVGEGGFGRVYLARSAPEDRLCALKGIRRRLLSNPDAIREFHLEIIKWIRLGAHPNIVHAYGMEIFLRLPFIVLEYVEGAGSLRQRMTPGRGDWKEALRVGCRIASGLEHAHRISGLVHRDLKPENVIVAGDGTAKITDFGLSLVRSIAGGAKYAVVGTPAYISPEQWKNPDAVDVRTDVYAFGVMLFELLTGRRPFPDSFDLEEIRRNHLALPPPDPSEMDGTIPRTLADFTLRCLGKRREDRPADFEAVAKSLEAMAEEHLGGSPFRGRPPIVPTRIDSLVNEAKTYENLKMFDAALDAVERALKIDPDHVPSLITKGNVLDARGDLEGSIRATLQAHRLDPSHLAPIANLAQRHMNAGRREEAARWVDRAVETARRQDSVERLEGLTFVVVQLMSPERALEFCDAVLHRNPLSIVALNNKAILLRRNGRLPEALEAVDRALQLNPAYAKGWTNRANVLIMMRRFQEGLESAERAILFDPETAGAYAAKATALAQMGRVGEGIQAFRDGLRALPGNAMLEEGLRRFSS